jgi:dTDP-4-dehydrorhamnose 3,5-epimerase
MRFQPTKLAGVFEIEIEARADERGFFARTWCREEFQAHGLNPALAQCSISFNHLQGTLRGMHFQAAPYQEAKLVRCTRGSLFDVALDLRPASPTFLQWTGVTLTADARNMLYIPEGCAHGFLTLENDTEALYQIAEFYHPEASRGVRWDDHAFQIAWPRPVTVISERDRTYSDFSMQVFL